MTAFPFKIQIAKTIEGVTTNVYVPLDGSDVLPSLAYQGASFSFEDLESGASGTNQYGETLRDVVTRKWHWSLEFAPMSSAKLAALLSAVDSDTFMFEFPNVLTGSGTLQRECFVTSRTAPFWDWQPGTATAKYGNVTFDVQEV